MSSALVIMGSVAGALASQAPILAPSRRAREHRRVKASLLRMAADAHELAEIAIQGGMRPPGMGWVDRVDALRAEIDRTLRASNVGLGLRTAFHGAFEKIRQAHSNERARTPPVEVVEGLREASDLLKELAALVPNERASEVSFGVLLALGTGFFTGSVVWLLTVSDDASCAKRTAVWACVVAGVIMTLVAIVRRLRS